MTEFCIDTTDKGKTRDMLNKLSACITAKAGKYVVAVKRLSGSGTTKIRRFYHAAIVNELVEYRRAQGEVVGHDQCHEFFKQQFRDKVAVVHPVTGELVGEIPKDGGDMTVDDWCRFIELCTVFLAEMGVRAQSSEDWMGK